MSYMERGEKDHPFLNGPARAVETEQDHVKLLILVLRDSSPDLLGLRRPVLLGRIPRRLPERTIRIQLERFIAPLERRIAIHERKDSPTVVNPFRTVVGSEEGELRVVLLAMENDLRNL